MIPFTHYALPNGKRSRLEIEISSEPIQALADKLLAAGCRFESEVLRTGQVSLTVVGLQAGEELDLACIICRNEYGFIARAIEALVARAAHRYTV